jgi:signal transduction histidine kinase
MVVISLTILGMGGFAAWNIQRQQVTTQNTILREVEGVFAVQNIYRSTIEVAQKFQDYDVEQNKDISKLASLRDKSETAMRAAEPWIQSKEEEALILKIENGYHAFWENLDDALKMTDVQARHDRLTVLFREQLVNNVRKPSEQYMEQSHEVMDRADKASQATTDLSRQGFLLIGLCGCAGGLVAGVAVARTIRQTLVRLDVSVRGVADSLGVAGHTVTFSQEGSIQEMESGLREMGQHVVTLVERLQQAEIEMLRNEHFAALGQLAAGLAHEIRNPLMPIKMLVQTALAREGELSRRSMEIIVAEIKRLEQTLQTFLDFARPQPPSKTSFPLSSVVERTEHLLSTKLRQQNVDVVVSGSSKKTEILADQTQLQQILLNLFLNAIDAMPTGGSIYVDAVDVIDKGIELTAIRIRDTGPGFPPDMLEKLFEPFATTKETGTGLGLSICQRLVQAHGGTIRADNAPEGGASFVITFPKNTDC